MLHIPLDLEVYLRELNEHQANCFSNKWQIRCKPWNKGNGNLVVHNMNTLWDCNMETLKTVF